MFSTVNFPICLNMKSIIGDFQCNQGNSIMFYLLIFYVVKVGVMERSVQAFQTKAVLAETISLTTRPGLSFFLSPLFHWSSTHTPPGLCTSRCPPSCTYCSLAYSPEPLHSSTDQLWTDNMAAGLSWMWFPHGMFSSCSLSSPWSKRALLCRIYGDPGKQGPWEWACPVSCSTLSTNTLSILLQSGQSVLICLINGSLAFHWVSAFWPWPQWNHLPDHSQRHMLKIQTCPHGFLT